MAFSLVVLVVGLVGCAYLLTHAQQLADQPRRGTEWRPSRRTYVLLALLLLGMASAALVELLTS